MGAELQRVRFATSFENIHDLNPSFAIGRMRIAYVGDNRNGSSISKDVLTAAIPSMYNCPIVARYDRLSNSFGSHDIEVVLEDNKIKIVNVTQPVGVVPSGAEYSFEVDVDGNGVQHEYLATDVILWKRQEAFDHICEVGVVDESMECVFEESHIDSRGYLVADKIYFEAFCLLESAAPCYEGANVSVFDDDGAQRFKRQYARMMSELAEYAEPSSGNRPELSQEGGNDMNLDDATLSAILEEFGVSREDLDFEITDDMTVEGFRDMVSAFVAEHSGQPEDSAEPEPETPVEEPEEDPEDVAAEDPSDEPVEEPSDEPEAEPDGGEPRSFAATYNEKRYALIDALAPVITEAAEVYFYLMDFDDKYAFVERDVWTPSNRESGYGRVAYAYDNETMKASLTGDFEPMVVTWLTMDEQEALEQRRALLDELIAYRDNTETANYRNAINELFSEFEDLKDTDEFVQYAQEVRSCIDTPDDRPSLDDVRMHCYSIRGKHQTFNKKLTNDKVPRVAVALKSKPKKSEDDYGDLFTTYGNR